jgi:hypothetical protein
MFSLATADLDLFYDQLAPLRLSPGNKKHFSTVIDHVKVDYWFAKQNGTVEVYISNSRRPFKVGNEDDRIRLLVFLGQVR